MHRNHLFFPAYLLAGVLLLLSLVDFAILVRRADRGDLAWRIGSEGLGGRSLVLAIIAVLIAYVVAIDAKHRLMLRTIATVCGVIGGVLLAIIPFFINDAAHLYGSAHSELRWDIRLSAFAGFANCALGGTAALLLAFFGRRAHTAEVERRAIESTSVHPRGMLVVSDPNGARTRLWVSTDASESRMSHRI
jgi:hypothetical protein